MTVALHPHAIELSHPIGQTLQKENARAAITAMLPAGVSFHQVLMETYHATMKNPEIAQCTIPSIVRAVGLAARTGLIIGETVHLVPFNVKVSKKGEPDRWEKRLEKINDYKGDIELVQRSGAARSVIAKVVYQGEIDGGRFDYQEGTDTRIMHRPILIPKDRGAVVGAYAVATVSPNLPPVVVWMHLSEIEAIRKGSKQWSPEKVAVAPSWYLKKTVVKQVVKFLSKNGKVAGARDLFDTEEPVRTDDDGDVSFLGVAAPRDAVDVLNDTSGDLRFPGEEDDLAIDREVQAREQSL